MQLVPGHCGQHSPGSETGSAQGGGPQRRARHCTLPLCVQRWTGQAGLVAGAKETPASAHPTVVDLPWPPQVPPRLPWTPPPIQVADSPDSDTGGRRQWGGGSLLHWDTLSQQRHSLGKGTAIGLGEDRLTL